MSRQQTEWSGEVKQYDDFHGLIIDAFVDGRTRMGPWAIMNPRNHEEFGVGLGTGKGQKYEKVEADGITRWVKTEG